MSAEAEMRIRYLRFNQPVLEIGLETYVCLSSSG